MKQNSSIMHSGLTVPPAMATHRFGVFLDQSGMLHAHVCATFQGNPATARASLSDFQGHNECACFLGRPMGELWDLQELSRLTGLHQRMHSLRTDTQPQAVRNLLREAEQMEETGRSHYDQAAVFPEELWEVHQEVIRTWLRHKKNFVSFLQSPTSRLRLNATAVATLLPGGAERTEGEDLYGLTREEFHFLGQGGPAFLDTFLLAHQVALVSGAALFRIPRYLRGMRTGPGRINLVGPVPLTGTDTPTVLEQACGLWSPGSNDALSGLEHALQVARMLGE